MEERSKIIINNIIVALVTQGDFPKDQLADWLETEIGMTEEEISEIPFIKEAV